MLIGAGSGMPSRRRSTAQLAAARRAAPRRPRPASRRVTICELDARKYARATGRTARVARTHGDCSTSSSSSTRGLAAAAPDRGRPAADQRAAIPPTCSSAAGAGSRPLRLSHITADGGRQGQRAQSASADSRALDALLRTGRSDRAARRRRAICARAGERLARSLLAAIGARGSRGHEHALRWSSCTTARRRRYRGNAARRVGIPGARAGPQPSLRERDLTPRAGGQRARDGQLRVLMVVDPTEDLPSAREKALRCNRCCDGARRRSSPVLLGRGRRRATASAWLLRTGRSTRCISRAMRISIELEPGTRRARLRERRGAARLRSGRPWATCRRWCSSMRARRRA